MLKPIAVAFAILATLPAAAEPPAPPPGAAPGPVAERYHEDLLYAALCRGVLWPDDQPTRLAAQTLPADTALELRVRAGLDAVAAGDPALGRQLIEEAAAGGHWLAETLAAGGTATADHVRLECTQHLEILAPSLQPPLS